jgi:hypothetical protein
MPYCSEFAVMMLARACLAVLTVGFLTFLAACGDSLQRQDAPVRTTVITHSAMRSYDVLAIVDDTAAFAPYRETVAAGLSDLAKLFQTTDGSLPSIHAAFVPASTSRADCSAQAPHGKDCGLTGEDRLAGVDGCGANPNFSGTLPSTFACLGTFEAGDCAGLMPLAAMRAALGGDPEGAGPLTGPTSFLRPDAALVILVFTSGDDASAQDGTLVPVQEYVDLIRRLKPDPTPVFVSIVVPPPVTSASRLVEFAQSFGAGSVLFPLSVGGNIAPAFQSLFQRLAVLLGRPCATGIRDLNPDLAGPQVDCTVEDWSTVVDDTVPREVHSQLPSCDVSSPPCWRFSPSPAFGGCPTGSWVVDIQRGSDWCASYASKTVLSCRGCADPNDPACLAP